MSPVEPVIDVEPRPEHAEPRGDSEAPSEPGRFHRLRSSLRRHPLRFFLGLVLLAGLLVAAFFLWRYLASYEHTDDAQIDGHISAVSARIDGTVVAVYVEDNQRVVAGQLLVELDPRDEQVALDRARAELSRAEATLLAAHPSVPITRTSNQTRIASVGDDVSDARAALAGAERNRQSAEASLREALANEERARSDIGRYRYLVGRNAVTPETYDGKLAAEKSARAVVDEKRALAGAAAQSIAQQRARLTQARSRQREADHNAPRQLAIQTATVASDAAGTAVARANVEAARLRLGYTRIFAPVDGIVGRRTVELGAHVQPGQSLLAIVEVDPLWVTANYKETQLGRIRVGQSARFKVDALGVALDGEVESLGGASGARFSLFPPENATGNYVKVVQRIPIRIRIDPSQSTPDAEAALSRLRPGMSVEPKVWLK